MTTGQTGTPRNHPLSPLLAHALQADDLRLLTILEQRAWVQAVRPIHMHGMRVENDDPVLLWNGVPGEQDLSPESFGRRAIRQQSKYHNYRPDAAAGMRAHGFEHYDVEHWSTDLLFDYWTISGDAWAQDELRHMGECLRGLLRPEGFYTSTVLPARAEGWAMQSFVQVFLATGDLRYRDAALDRMHDIVDRDRMSTGLYRAVQVSGSDRRTTWPEPHSFYMPWQHGVVLFGYLGAWKFFGDPLARTICEDVTYGVDRGWVSNVQDPTHGFVANGLRYYVPLSYLGQPVTPDAFDATHGVKFGDDPLRGAHSILAAGLLMVASVSDDPERRSRALLRGQLLLPSPLSDEDRWGKWYYCVPAAWNR